MKNVGFHQNEHSERVVFVIEFTITSGQSQYQHIDNDRIFDDIDSIMNLGRRQILHRLNILIG